MQRAIGAGIAWALVVGLLGAGCAAEPGTFGPGDGPASDGGASDATSGQAAQSITFEPPSPIPILPPIIIPPPCDTNNTCFGAVGGNCNGLGVPLNGIYGGCNSNGCLINAGSWLHDECCFDNPTGTWCSPGSESSRSACGSEWDVAVHRTTHGLSWRRPVNMCAGSTTGVVNFAEYCAPDGTIVAASDAGRCCGGATRRYNGLVDGAQAARQQVAWDASFAAVVCMTPAPTDGTLGTGATCTSNAQCASQSCVAVPFTTTRRCL